MHFAPPSWFPQLEARSEDVGACDGCGACCMQQGHPPYTDDELARVPAELKAPLDAYLAALEEDDTGRPCLWLDLETRQCQHYDHRPQICRDFERGSPPCKLVRWRYRIEDARSNTPVLLGPRMKTLPVIESCDDCGACCMQQGHPPFTDDERQLLPYELLAPIDEHLSSLEEDDFGQPCLWLDPETKQCQNYDYRPQVCRDFERGSDYCVRLRLRYKVGL